MDRPSVLIRVDGGGRVGHGHLYRMQALALELRERGAEVDFITRTPEIRPLLGETALSGMLLDDGPEATQGPRLLEFAAEYDILVVDLPELPDSNPPEHQTIHLIPRSHPWPGLPAPTGWEHVILRREFSLSQESRRYPPVGVGLPSSWSRWRLYCSAGGADTAGLERLLLTSAWKASYFSTYSDVLTPRDTFSGKSSSSEVAALMNCCHLALITYGMTALECAARGLPSVCICPTEHHAEGARQLEAAGACVSLGLERDPEVIARVALDLLAQPGRLRAMSEVGPRLVDGHGAGRVAQHVLSLVKGKP